MIIFYQIIELSVSFIETFICFKFLNLFFKDRLEIKKKNICMLIYSIVITSCIFLNNLISIYSNFLLLFVILTISISALHLLKTKWVYSLTVVGLYYLIITLFDLLVIFMLSIFTGDQEIGDSLIAAPSLNRTIFICAMKVILILIYIWLKKLFINFSNLLKYWIFWLGMVILGFCALFYFQRFALDKVTELIASDWMLFLIIALMVTVLFYMYVKYRDYKEKNVLINVRSEILEKSYLDLQSLFKNNEHVMHDFRNHIAIISNYIRKYENEKALTYIESIATPINNIKKIVWSGIEIVDIILNCKMAESEKYDIKMQFDIEINKCNIDEKDFCSILSNILDNAIESSKKSEKEDRFIDFSMKSINKMLMIRIKNNMSFNPKISKYSKFETTKLNKKGHGIGLESVKHSVEKYDGNIKFNYGENFFEVQILLLSV